MFIIFLILAKQRFIIWSLDELWWILSHPFFICRFLLPCLLLCLFFSRLVLIPGRVWSIMANTILPASRWRLLCWWGTQNIYIYNGWLLIIMLTVLNGNFFLNGKFWCRLCAFAYVVVRLRQHKGRILIVLAVIGFVLMLRVSEEKSAWTTGILGARIHNSEDGEGNILISWDYIHFSFSVLCVCMYFCVFALIHICSFVHVLVYCARVCLQM